MIEGERALSRLATLERGYWIDKDATAAEGAAWLDEFGADRDNAVGRRLQVLIASIRSRRGDARESALTVQRILASAVENGETALRSRCHAELGSVFEMVGARDLALENAVIANDLIDDDEEPLMRAAARLGLADSLATSGSFAEARRRYAEALALVADDSETGIRYMILNNLAFTEFISDRPAEAAAAIEELISLSAVNNRAIGLYARDTIGRIYLASGRLDDAQRILLPAMESLSDNSNPDSEAMCLIALAEVYRAQGMPDRAQRVIDRCLALAERFGLGRWMTQAAREQAETSAALGDFERAFTSYRSFHEQFLALTATENEARALILDAVFQTTEARRESTRYRDLAERDSLTGLFNRRYVDEHLGAVLQQVRDGGPGFSIAMIDLDHFKRVNDTLSHEIGDDVLRVIGELLQEAADSVPNGVAARLGGEEFLLILPSTARDDAHGRFDAVCKTIADRDWSAITGNLPVTASIGVAAAPADGTESSDLLRAADVRLYVAKRAGRNRVVHAVSVADA